MRGAITAAVASVGLSWLFKAVWASLPFMDRMGVVFLVSLALAVVVSVLVPTRRDADTIETRNVAYRTRPGFNIGALGVILIRIALYAMVVSPVEERRHALGRRDQQRVGDDPQRRLVRTAGTACDQLREARVQPGIFARWPALRVAVVDRQDRAALAQLQRRAIVRVDDNVPGLRPFLPEIKIDREYRFERSPDGWRQELNASP